MHGWMSRVGNRLPRRFPSRYAFLCVAVEATSLVGCSSAEQKSVPVAARDDSAPNVEEVLPPADSGVLPVPQVVAYPATDQWSEAGARQRARADRSFAELKQRNVPAYEGPLFVADDDQVRLQEAPEVARRAIILWAVALRAEGTPREEVIELMDKASAWEIASPSERRFLQAPEVDPAVAPSMVWRLESLWVMLWALGHIDSLSWPDDLCNVPRLVEVMRVEESRATFVSDARLRSVQEILDAQDLIMRIHWAIRDASLREPATIPANLDWTNADAWVPISQCPGVGVVEERHHALNWLVNFLDPENWDEVDTPT